MNTKNKIALISKTMINLSISSHSRASKKLARIILTKKYNKTIMIPHNIRNLVFKKHRKWINKKS